MKKTYIEVAKKTPKRTYIEPDNGDVVVFAMVDGRSIIGQYHGEVIDDYTEIVNGFLATNLLVLSIAVGNINGGGYEGEFSFAPVNAALFDVINQRATDNYVKIYKSALLMAPIKVTGNLEKLYLDKLPSLFNQLGPDVYCQFFTNGAGKTEVFKG